MQETAAVDEKKPKNYQESNLLGSISFIVGFFCGALAAVGVLNIQTAMFFGEEPIGFYLVYPLVGFGVYKIFKGRSNSWNSGLLAGIGTGTVGVLFLLHFANFGIGMF